MIFYFEKTNVPNQVDSDQDQYSQIIQILKIVKNVF